MYRKIEWRDGWPWVQTVPGGPFRKASAELHDELLQDMYLGEQMARAGTPTTP